ncbi:hypothetical protein [Leifsonia sp. Leaf264]|uniref:hypothetical protein n=1 Tax=Leifsonia sp. Leaf264 TaxID=1736314 RepID=UPI0006FA26C3|nr:hypothetical protein [Leifsonia sp. Leaf264]KQO98742.1 hypothetical protein ASF30_11820 [Leifsonia sp. Leaf264]
MTDTNTYTPSEVRTRQIAQEAIDGQINEADARRQIAWLIVRDTNVVTDVAHRSTRDERHRYLEKDLQAELFDLLLKKVDGDDTPSSLNLQRIADGASAVGWARQLLTTAAKSEIRNLAKRDSFALLTDPTAPNSEDSMSNLEFAYHMTNSTSDADAVDEEYFETYDQHLDANETEGFRETRKLNWDAKHLRAVYRIDAPIVVPEDSFDRAWVLDQLKATPMLAFRSLHQWLAIVSGSWKVTDQLDDRLLGLWDDFTIDQADDLAGLDAVVAHTIATAAITGLPKPSRPNVQAAVRIVAAAVPGSAWRRNAKDLVNAWIAKECAFESDFNTKSAAVSSDAQEALIAAHEIIASTWAPVAKATTEWANQPLGRTEDDVRKFVLSVFQTVDPANFPA